METKAKKVVIWVVAIIFGVVVYCATSGVFASIEGLFKSNDFTVLSEEFGYVNDKYYSSNRLYPDRCPSLNFTIKNNSNKSLHVYGEVNFYKDGSLFETAYLSTDTLAPGDTITTNCSAINGVFWNFFDSYNWSYKIIYLRCNYA